MSDRRVPIHDERLSLVQQRPEYVAVAANAKAVPSGRDVRMIDRATPEFVEDVPCLRDYCLRMLQHVAAGEGEEIDEATLEIRSSAGLGTERWIVRPETPTA